MKTGTTKKIIISAIFIALGVVLSRKLSIPIAITGSDISMNIGFGMLPILLIAIMYGPIWGCAASLLWDVLGALIFPLGAFNPLFSLAAATLGLVTGLFFTKAEDASPLRTFFAILSGQLLYSVVLNTVLIVWLYSAPFWAILLPRLAENALMIFINTSLILLIIDTIRKYNLLPERFRPLITETTSEDEDYTRRRYLLERGNHFLMLKQYSLAAQMYCSFIEESSDSDVEETVVASIYLLECYIELGNIEEAQATLDGIEAKIRENQITLSESVDDCYNKCTMRLKNGTPISDSKDTEADTVSESDRHIMLFERAEHYRNMQQYVLALQMYFAYLDCAVPLDMEITAQIGILECYINSEDVENARAQYGLILNKWREGEYVLTDIQKERFNKLRSLI